MNSYSIRFVNKRIWIRFDLFINSIKRTKRIELNIRLINKSNPNPEISIRLLNESNPNSQNFDPIRLGFDSNSIIRFATPNFNR